MIKFKILKEVDSKNCRDIQCYLFKDCVYQIDRVEKVSAGNLNYTNYTRYTILLFSSSISSSQWISDFDLNNLIRLKYIQVIK